MDNLFDDIVENDVFLKCSNDIVFFANNLYKDYSKGEYRQLTLRDYQEDIITKMVSSSAIHWNSARCMGKTYLGLVVCAWKAIFSPNSVSLLVLDGVIRGKYCLQKLMYSIEYLAEYMPTIAIDRVEQIKNFRIIHLKNKSQIKICNVHGYRDSPSRYDLAYYDDISLILPMVHKKFVENYKNISISFNSKNIFVGTMKLYDKYISDLPYYACTWRDLYGNDEEWKQKIIAFIGIEQFELQYELELRYGTDAKSIDAIDRIS